MAYSISGLDCSRWQGKPDWAKAKAQGIRFVIVKAGEVWIKQPSKPAITDIQHDRNIAQLKAVGIPCGNYYYMHPSQGASKQANHYAQVYLKSKPTLPPCIDLEDTDGCAPKEVCRQLFAFIDAIEDKIGITPIIYSRNGFIVNQVGDPVWKPGIKFWIARYAQTIGSLSPKIKDNTIIWQFTDRIKLPGLPVMDGNWWIKSDQEFNDFVQNNVQPEPTPEPLPEPFYKQGRVIVSKLNIRNTPDWQNNMVIGALHKGDIVDISKVYNVRWAEIEPGKYAAMRGESGTYIERII
jgi:lysozyme